MSPLPEAMPPPVTMPRFLRTCRAKLPGAPVLRRLSIAVFLSFWGHYHFPVWAYVAGVTLLAASLAAILGMGRETRTPPGPLGPAGQRPALSAGFPDPLPAFPESGLRSRYGIFTLIGALLLFGLAWRLLAARRSFQGLWRLIPLGLLVLMAVDRFWPCPGGPRNTWR